MIVEMANVNADDGTQNYQQVKLILRLGVFNICKAEYTIHGIKDSDIMLGKTWMLDINHQYQIEHGSNDIWTADNLCATREASQVHYLPCLHPLDVNKGIM